MAVRYRKIFKQLATWLPYSPSLGYLVALPKLRHWQRRFQAAAVPTFPSRLEYWDFVAAHMGHEPLVYLEFGVYQGFSMNYFVRNLPSPSARFFGFDTFSGLPEEWQHFMTKTPKGVFDTGGAIPRLRDPRVTFIKGLFQDTLGPFLAQGRIQKSDRLLVHLDADLYSSTLFVLCRLADYLKPGDWLLLDEFPSIPNEFQALEDFVNAFRLSYRLRAQTRDSDQVAIEITG